MLQHSGNHWTRFVKVMLVYDLLFCVYNIIEQSFMSKYIKKKVRPEIALQITINIYAQV